MYPIVFTFTLLSQFQTLVGQAEMYNANNALFMVLLYQKIARTRRKDYYFERWNTEVI